jgi:chemotaxis-related protein WspB
MLVLLFETTDGRYAIDTRHIVEVVPFVHLKKIPQAQGAVAGLANYRGRPLPVVDLGLILEGAPSPALVSTRILIIAGPWPDTDPAALLGLIVPRATETFRSRAKRQASGVLMDEELYNGAIASDAKGMVQLIDLPQLLPAADLAGLLQAGQ